MKKAAGALEQEGRKKQGEEQSFARTKGHQNHGEGAQRGKRTGEKNREGNATPSQGARGAGNEVAFKENTDP